MKKLTNESSKTASGKSNTTVSILEFGSETYTAMKDVSGNVYVLVDVDASGLNLERQELKIKGAVKLLSAKDSRGFVEFNVDQFASKQIANTETKKVKVFLDLSTKK